MIIISDTSPLVCFLHLKRIDILNTLFSEIIIPSSVYKELNTFKIIDKDFLQVYPFITIKNSQNNTIISELLKIIDIGEAEAIALSIELKPDLLLIDESKGRELAQQYNIPIKGVLGVLTLAKEKNIISQIKPFIDQLQNEINFRINKVLLSSVLKAANEQ